MVRPLLETEHYSNRRLSCCIKMRSSGFKVASYNYFNYSVHGNCRRSQRPRGLKRGSEDARLM
jgi:hypothetical protein